MVLLAWQLAKIDIEVFLVPMYQNYEVFLLKPNLVLVNYARKANKSFIDTCSIIGISVGVLDTEGGLLKNADEYFENVSKYVENVDLYCLWGKIQYEALKKNNILKEKSLKITGCPRYDFLAEPWKNALDEIRNVSGKMVLLNTNFPIVHPRFQSAYKEKEDLIKVVGLEENYVNNLIDQTKVAFEEILKIINYLSPKFQDVTFVVRPHPFEDSSIYKESFKDLSNVEIHQSGTVFPWINNALVLLHYNCSTAIESFLLGKEPIYFKWIETPLLDQPASIDVSQHAYSLKKLEEMLRTILDAGQLIVSEEILLNRKLIVKNWFNENDGKNSERVADAIIETINENKKNIRNINYFKEFINHYMIELNPKSYFRIFVQAIFGNSFYNRLKRIILKRSGEAKSFDIFDVKRIVDRIEKVDRNFNVKIKKAKKYSFFIKIVKYSSVMIKRNNS
jgi:surface carbohydrate biosynthesis protein